MIYAFRLCASREPDQFEMQKLMELLEDQKKYFDGRTSAAVYVTATDPNRMPEDVDLHKVAPWTMVARVLLNHGRDDYQRVKAYGNGCAEEDDPLLPDAPLAETARWKRCVPRSALFTVLVAEGFSNSSSFEVDMKYNEEIKIEARRLLTRRWFFKECGIGLGSLALASLMEESHFAQSQSAIANPLAPKQPHFKPKAKRVIYLFMAGGPSQFETFDYKPSLAKYNGKPVPQEFVKDLNYAFIRPDAGLYASELKFAQHGQSGTWVSEALPYTAQVVDEIAVVRSAQTDAINHAPAQIFMNTGSTQYGRPSVGAWVTYGLGSESQDLPAFVVMSSAGGLSGGSSNFGCGFLPTIYQGVAFRKSGDPILSLSNPRGVTPEMQRKSLDALKALNEHHLELTGDPEIVTRINSFEMAYRMQTSAPELMDVSKESKETLEMYGVAPGALRSR